MRQCGFGAAIWLVAAGWVGATPSAKNPPLAAPKPAPLPAKAASKPTAAPAAPVPAMDSQATAKPAKPAKSEPPPVAEICFPMAPPPAIKADQVYTGKPFGQGELTRYKVYYAGILVGYGHLEVLPPVQFQGHWQMVFAAEASTGDWYSAIFKAEEKIKSFAYPSNFGVTKFRIHQDEGDLIGERFIQDKWLDYSHTHCKARETAQRPGRKPSQKEVFFAAGSAGVMGGVFKLRTLDLTKMNKPLRFPVYSSQKNWWLEAIPVAVTELTLPVGKLKATELRLKTYIGNELQQKGDVSVWIAHEHPSRLLLQITGEIKIGSVNMELVEFRPGA